MVGVANRSKSCVTCKSRKIACSQERPHCRTCVKSNRDCAGYNNDRTFLAYRSKRSRTVEKKACPEPKALETTADSLTLSAPTNHKDGSKKTTPFETITFSEVNASDILSPKQILSASTNLSVQTFEHSVPTRDAFTSIWNTKSPTTRAVYRDQIIGEFLFVYLPNMETTAEDGRSKNGNWLSMLPSFPNITTALEAAALAVCTAKLGRVHNDSTLVRESLKFYTQALWEVQRALFDPKLMYKEGTLAACMLLIMYEVLECPDQTFNAWQNHLNGCAKLFESRGPKAYSSDFGHQLFLSFRQMEIQKAITERRSTFLSNNDWASLPWQGFQKPLAAHLLDLTAKMSGIVESGYNLLYHRKEPLKPADLLVQTLSIVDQCWKLDIRLRSFYNRFERETSGPVYWAELSKFTVSSIEESALGSVFPVAFRFPDMETAHICLLYWATLSILWSGMGFLYNVLAGFQFQLESQEPESSAGETEGSGSPVIFTTEELPPLEHRADVAALAKNICQSVEFCTQGGLGSFPATIVFPLKVAIETLHSSPDCGRELAWAEAAWAKIHGTGIRLLRHLGDHLTTRSYLPG